MTLLNIMRISNWNDSWKVRSRNGVTSMTSCLMHVWSDMSCPLSDLSEHIVHLSTLNSSSINVLILNVLILNALSRMDLSRMYLSRMDLSRIGLSSQLPGGPNQPGDINQQYHNSVVGSQWISIKVIVN